MALSRCIEHSPPKGLSEIYDRYVYPLGYPDTAVICGRTGCSCSGIIWLNEDEVQAYERGERIFQGPNNFTKMKADDRGLQQGIDKDI